MVTVGKPTLFVGKVTTLIDCFRPLIALGMWFGIQHTTNTQQMKRIILAVIFGVASLSSISTKAQVSLSINIGSQPQWGPTGYDHVDYYYLPDVDAYYNVPAQQYVYLEGGRWVWRASLPSRYSGYDLYNGYKVVMNTPKPYLSHQTHVREYSKYKNYRGKQGAIRDSRDSRYHGGNNNRPGQNNNNRPGQNNNNRPGQNNNNRPGQNNNNRPGQNNNRPDKNNNNGKPGQNNGRGNDNNGQDRNGRGH